MGSSWSSTEAQRRVGTMLVLTAIALGTSGCLEMYLRRDPPPSTARTAMTPPPSPRAKATGSLWRDDVSANFLFADTKARFPGDLLTIVIDERASGLNDADTSSSTETEVTAGIEQFFGFTQQLAQKNPTIDPTQMVKASTSREWDGEGTTSRRGNLSASMTAKVTAVAANGNLWIEGDKVVSVNKEDQHIVVAGWVRPEDIDAENRVLSSRLAEARVDYYGVGVVAMKQRPGWGYFLLDVVWPF
jgi:flagellar L-ring protein FlgH